jgi:hypothetical protein
MKINLRWLVQAVSLILGIYFFKLLFENSKTLFFNFSINTLFAWLGFFFLFALCFFLLLFTSYLKERGGNTLKHRIALFERVVALLGLDNFAERRALAENGRNGKAVTADSEVGNGNAGHHA